MAKTLTLCDIIYEAMILPDEELKICFLEALAELEDNECHRTRKFQNRLHKVGVKQEFMLISIKSQAGVSINTLMGKFISRMLLGQRHDDVLR